MPKHHLLLALCALVILGLTAGACTSDSEPGDAGPTASGTATVPGEDGSSGDGIDVGDTTTIANTNGRGVGLRSHCTDDAVSGGAWAETTIVAIEEIGSNECEGWSRVSSGVTTSWVRNENLEDAPVAVSASPGSSDDDSSDSEGTSTPSSGTSTSTPGTSSTPKPQPTTTATTQPTPKATIVATPAPPTPEPPKLTASTYLLDFGAQAVGDGTARTITLRNDGTETVTVLSTLFENGESASGYFQTSGNSCLYEPVIPPTGGCGLSVSFVPQEIGTYTAQLEVRIQGRSTPIVITVRGDATFD